MRTHRAGESNAQPLAWSPAHQAQLFRQTTDELVRQAETFFDSNAWSRAVRDNEVSHPHLRLPRSILFWRIREYADVIVTLGSNHFSFVEASQRVHQADKDLDLVVQKLDALSGASKECLESFSGLATHPGVLLDSDSAEAIRASLQSASDELQRARRLATRGMRAKGFNVKALRGFGLNDVGFIAVHRIARFRDADPDLKLNIFALACAWELFEVKHKHRCTPSWGCFDRQFRRWSTHPYAADIATSNNTRNNNFMSEANGGV